MTNWKFEKKELQKLQASMVQSAKEINGPAMMNAMRDALLVITASAKRNAPVDRGIVRASITPNVIRRDDTIVGIVGSNRKEAAYAEFGTKPHWPPIQPILEWVHRKRLAGKGKGKKRSNAERSIAFVIARGISRRGTSMNAMRKLGTMGYRFLKRAMDENKQKVHSILLKAVKVVAKK